jgi:hypothetical protein
MNKPKTYLVGLVVRVGRSTALVERKQRARSPRQAAWLARRKMLLALARAEVEAVAL